MWKRLSEKKMAWVIIGKIHHNTIIQDAQIFLGRWKVEDGPINATNMQKRNPYVQSAAVPALRREMMGG